VNASTVPATGALTVEFWLRPAENNGDAVVVAQTDDFTGFSIEVNNGFLTVWLVTDQGWRSVEYTGTALQAGQWYHVGFTYASGSARAFVNGAISNSTTVGTLTQGPNLRVGGFPGYGFFNGTIDELRFSNIARYNGTYSVPSAPFVADGNTTLLWSFDEGSGQTVADESSSNNNGTLGSNNQAESSDPSWVAGYGF
jgi:hypothetical protein